MSDTPRTDAGLEYDDTTVDDVKDFARQLERELNAAHAKIKWLEETGDEMADLLEGRAVTWIKAKEDKP